MSQPQLEHSKFRVAKLRQSGETRFDLAPEKAARDALAATLGIEAIRKLRFAGALIPQGRNSWRLEADLGATAIQSCVVTLEPVTTRIDTTVTRRFVPSAQIGEFEAGSETEMPDDDTLEPLGEVIDIAAVMAEALALALPAYPRKDGEDLGEAVFAEDGVAPLTDDDLRPFAGLSALRDKLQTRDDDS